MNRYDVMNKLGNLEAHFTKEANKANEVVMWTQDIRKYIEDLDTTGYPANTRDRLKDLGCTIGGLNDDITKLITEID